MPSTLPEVRIVQRRRGGSRIHPWVFRDLLSGSFQAGNGEVVRVVSRSGSLLGHATYSSHSKIALRWITRDERVPDDRLWRERVDAAVALRRRVAPDAEALRVVFGESDGLPGLIVDRYGSHLVVQCLTAAAERVLPLVLDRLSELDPVESVLARNAVGVRKLEGLPLEVKQLRGRTPEAITIGENGLSFCVDPWSGQKTGAFLDQRENRAVLGGYASGRVLDVFSYQGGFALHAARAADEVIAVDSSEAALERGRADAAANGLECLRWVKANAFEDLRQRVREGEVFDLVCLDPPALAKSRGDVNSAVRAYKECNLRAMRLLRPGGILVTSSCSYNLSETRFLSILEEASADAGRRVQLLERRMQSRDHPVLVGFPESHYLKCLVLSVS